LLAFDIPSNLKSFHTKILDIGGVIPEMGINNWSWRATLAAFLAVLIWSVLPGICKYTVASVSITWMLLARFGIGSIVMLPWLLPVIKKAKEISPTRWFLLAINLGANYYFQNRAIQGIPASFYIVIFSLAPIFSLIFLRKPLAKGQLFPFVTVVAGSIGFARYGDLKTNIDFTSTAALLIGMATWVWYTVQITHFQKIYDDKEVTIVTTFVSLIVVLLLWGIGGFPMEPLTRGLVYSFLFLGLGTPLAYYFFLYGLRRVPVMAVVSQYAEPVFGIAFALAFLGEKLSLRQLSASAIIVFGMIWFSARASTGCEVESMIE
jgi:drug/metabolite transporter (DMT)-like permease